jgi:cytochrome c-type biogenesis protein CcmH
MLAPALAILALLVAAPASAQAPSEKPLNDRAYSSRAFISQVVGAPAAKRLSGSALDRKTDEVAGLLRCPVCQGSTVADSPSSTARNMKAEVRDLLAQGFDQEQVLRYFELSYGEFVRLAPEAKGVNILVWALPLAALVLGLAVMAVSFARYRSRKARPTPAREDVPGRDALPPDEELAGYVRRVRELAYGWPQGVSPTAASSGSAPRGGGET